MFQLVPSLLPNNLGFFTSTAVPVGRITKPIKVLTVGKSTLNQGPVRVPTPVQVVDGPSYVGSP